MQLLKLTLEGFRRFGLSKIQTLIWTPTSTYQMILGSNGSGKSSLLRECSPLPAAVEAFTKNGKKVVHYEHEGHQYILSTKFSPKAEHSFLRDGVEMNTGGTGAIQKQLVESYFQGYNEEIHAILTGQIGFTGMSVADRRRWLTRMSQDDYRYALSLFDRLKVAARDLQGHLKHLKQRIHDETLALKEGPVIGILAPEVKNLQDELTALLYARTPSSQGIDASVERLHKQREVLERSGEALTRQTELLDLTLTERSARGLERQAGALEAQAAILESSLNRYRVDYSDTEAIQLAMVSADIDDLASLERRLEEQRLELTALQGQLDVFTTLSDCADPSILKAATEEVLSGVMEVFSQLPDNSTRWVSREALDQHAQALRLSQAELEGCELEIVRLQGRLHALEHAERVTCPQCKYAWVPGLDPKDIPVLKTSLTEFQTKRETVQLRLKTQEEQSTKLQDYLTLYRQWKGYVNQYPSLKPLWEYIQVNQFDTNHPQEHREIFLTWYREIELACTAAALAHRIKEQETLLAKTPQGEQRLLKDRLVKLAETIETLTHEKRGVEHEAKRLRKQETHYRLWERLRDEVTVASEGLNTCYDDALAALATSVMDADIERLQAQLGALQHALQAQMQRLDRLKSLEADQSKAERDFDALSLLASELSPKEGEIAERMHGFMTGWVGTLNHTLRQVWSYGLEVQPCVFDGGDLNYRFPVYLGDSDETSKDVEFTSTSIQQIIDLAFRQTFVRYLNLKDMPLFIDEIGANFDEAHRITLPPYLVRLMDSEYYCQLFMISHYQAGWSVFPEAEYLVVDERNITTPPVYNQHVVMG